MGVLAKLSDAEEYSNESQKRLSLLLTAIINMTAYFRLTYQENQGAIESKHLKT